MADERIVPLAGSADDEAPYFSLIIVPGKGGAYDKAFSPSSVSAPATRAG